MRGLGAGRAVALFTIAVLVHLAFGGPDPNPLSKACSTTGSLSREDRKVLKATVQTVHSLTSLLAQVKLGRPAGRNVTQQELETWLDGNRTAAEQRDPSGGRALSCLSHRQHSPSYQGTPVVSILLNYFKRPWAIRVMASSLAKSCENAGVGCEVVINVDNPHEAGEWAAVAKETGGFMVPVFSSNVHESRGYNRAAKVARGRYLVIWQDDQIAPASSSWVADVIRVFDAWPQLAILGMNTYRMCKNYEATNRFGATHWEPDGRTGVRWTFAQVVDFAPLVIRAQAFASLGGLDEGQSRSGDCGIWGDWELCNRAWMDGWQTGFLHMEGRAGDGHAGGTHTGGNAEKCWGRQQHVSSSGFHKRYGSPEVQTELCDKVWLLNVQAFSLSDPSKCPYAPTGLTKYANCSRPSTWVPDA